MSRDGRYFGNRACADHRGNLRDIELKGPVYPVCGLRGDTVGPLWRLDECLAQDNLALAHAHQVLLLLFSQWDIAALPGVTGRRPTPAKANCACEYVGLSTDCEAGPTR